MRSGITEALPDWLTEPFLGSQRRLLVLERRLQRRFLSEYRAQVKGVEPVLRERGNMIGAAIIDAFAGHHATRVSYADTEASEAAATAAADGSFVSQKSLKEMMQTLDPLISPVLNPFVEGLRTPIDAALTGIESDVKKTLATAAAISFLTGVVVGSLAAGARRRDK